MGNNAGSAQTAIPAGSGDIGGVASFAETLSGHDLQLRRGRTTALQVNVGLLCNQACRHCHLEAGPDRTELMSIETMKQVVEYARACSFQVVDITGGAPELNPDLPYLVENIAPLTPRLLMRSNLTAMAENFSADLMDLFKKVRPVIMASLPSTNVSQTESQRGAGVGQKSIDMLRRLNDLGYGHEGTGLDLNLISNPVGAFLPVSQAQAEKQFKRVLQRKWGITFSNLYTFANVPLGRFRQWLKQSGNFDTYMQRLCESFNPCALEGLMCRNMVSVSWDGYLYDCDFNLAGGIHLGGRQTHVSGMEGPPDPGSLIAVGDYCYACTAGSGFT